MGIDTDSPLAPVIRRRRLGDHPHLVVLDRSRPHLAENFRQICIRLERAAGWNDGAHQIIAVTSAVPGEGKTTVALNLALALAEDRERSTLLVDADMRLPAVASYLDPKPETGLSDVLAGSVPLKEALIKSLDNSKLAILAGGTPPAAPLELLRSRQFAGLLEELRPRYQRIIIDSAPVVPFADAEVLISLCDGVALVVRAGKTGKPLIEQLVEAVPRQKLLGLILNDLHPSPISRYGYRYDREYYAPRRSDGGRGASR